MENSDWSNLPDIPLLHIFSYLTGSDRSSAARICRRWSQAFQAPDLWRQRTMHFDSASCKLSHENKHNRFAKAFGKYLHHLQLYVSEPRPHIRHVRRISQAVSRMLRTLRRRGCQLKTMTAMHLYINRYWNWHEPVSKSRFITAFCRFFHSQTRLKCLDLEDADVNVIEGVKVLGAVAHRSGTTVEKLLLENFFMEQQEAFRIPSFLSTLAKFQNIRVLGLNYSALSDDVMDVLRQSLQGKLRNLSIVCRKHDPHSHVISNHTWHRLVAACPELNVDIDIERVPQYTQIRPLLQAKIPVNTFSLWTGFNIEREDNWNIRSTVHLLIRNYFQTLESVILELEDEQEVVDDLLKELLLNCPRITLLQFSGFLSNLDTAMQIAQMRIDNKSKYSKVHLILQRVSANEVSKIEEINSFYHGTLEEIGVDFQIEPDWLS